MFTIDQVKEAHSKVKSGADFPAYVQVLIKLGVISYKTYVSDGHARYTGKSDHVRSEAKYPTLEIAEKGNSEKFKHYLKIHQQGETDYLTFCKHAAETGVENWTVDMLAMTCTYYDLAGNAMLIEKIPAK